MDTVFIRELRADALLGFHKRERFGRQTLSIDIDIGIANRDVFSSDKVVDCIDYDRVAARIRELAGVEHFNLVETLAERIARLVLDEFGAARVKVTVAKLGVLRHARSAGVTIERESGAGS